MNDVCWTTGEFTTRDGLRLHYRDYAAVAGDALPVVCLHGLSRNSRDFEWIAAAIAPHRRVIAPDMRGRGHSDYDPQMSHYNPYQYVDDVWGLLDHLAMSRVVVLGTSLGGWMGALMATQRAQAVAAAIINDIGPELAPAGIARIQATVGTAPAVDHWEGAVAQTRRMYEVALPDLSAEMWHWYARSTYRPRASGGFDLNCDRNVGAAVRAGLSGLHDDPWELYDQLNKRPNLIIRGALSDVFAGPLLDAMHARYTDMRSVVIPNRGHVPLLNETEAVSAISTFLAQVD